MKKTDYADQYEIVSRDDVRELRERRARDNPTQRATRDPGVVAFVVVITLTLAGVVIALFRKHF